MRYNLLISLIFFSMFPVMKWLVAASSLPEFYQQFWQWGSAVEMTALRYWL